ncbi:leucoanthocyanidin reductase-like [Impatiens glandulifera]|uniref:leucoanthocyanidin reductase-like n=1 Tax=Impatiens glandulifera TaxID=253017 RepID=UPI001FB17E43|nr:leucoanthocyanidin reductase-like [Impatiens glandulifera]
MTIALVLSSSAAPKTLLPTLVIGATGFIGQFVAEASLDGGWPTYILLRAPAANSSSSKAKATKSLQEKGAIIIYGDMKDQKLVEKILKDHKIGIVISVVGGEGILDQITLIQAIKSVGTIKRFLPSEFGHDVDRTDPVEPGLNMYKEKRLVRRFTEESGIPYTYICCNSVASWPYYDNTHPSEVLPPLDRFHIYGDGTVKAYFVAGADIGKYTMKTVDDGRTINKLVHFRPTCNYLNVNELASLWEKKIQRVLPRITVSENDLLSAAAENIIPESIVASFTHDIFINGCQIKFGIDGPNEVEVTTLYPEECFKTVDDCFTEFASKIPNHENGKEVMMIKEEIIVEKEEKMMKKEKGGGDVQISHQNEHVVEAALPISMCA